MGTKALIEDSKTTYLDEDSMLPLRILIADGNPDNQARLCSKLQFLNAQITLVESGRECFEKALENEADLKFNLVILNVDLPVLDGFSTAMLIKENHAADKIVSITERGLFSYEFDSLRSGCDYHLNTKDFDTKINDIIFSISSN